MSPVKPTDLNQALETDNLQPSASAGKLLQILGVGFGLAVTIGGTIGMGILRTPGAVAATSHSKIIHWGLDPWRRLCLARSRYGR